MNIWKYNCHMRSERVLQLILEFDNMMARRLYLTSIQRH